MADRVLDLGWVRVFDAVGRLGSLTAAAQELGLSQPAVSYTVRILEQQLGTALLERGHRGSALSPAGERLHRAASAAVAELDAGARAIRRMSRRPVVRLFTDYGFASFWMMPRVAQFRRVHPETEVHIIASAAADPGADEAEDVAVLFGTRSDFGAGAIQLFEERVYPVCSPHFAARHGLGDDPRLLANSPLLHLESTPQPRWFSWRDWFAAMHVTRETGPSDLSLNTYGLVVQAAIADQGVALGWAGLIDAAIADGTLVAVGPPLSRNDSGYWVRPGPEPSAPVQDLIDWIIQQVRG
ncbi:putative choline sulfate-utilization transcription factor [Ancylobacter sp. 3268]|uniref:LysR substrate-binding domain-containing protein n=1 Tax=Ancylobacter sp. 3268 TaxID=2817752 RepID=UPI002854D80E|nr:LysR substrate-binding domain-containing protein [Ancylobacter sp. 3268]MDR6954869.1 putative choline sulfate-utilization transcription factor [Ancylobacter sp. 3268]